jgi:hypothetical protein
MVHIQHINVIAPFQIHIFFDDGNEKSIDFKPFINIDNALTAPLNDFEYFKTVKIYENGRGIYWDNDYDFCPDFLRHYA